jgi:D-alanine--poly(phosphoribitol) ligase subunit 2
MNTEEKILQILEQVTGTDEVRRDREISLFRAGLIDSLGAIEMLVAIDEELGIRIEPTEVDREEIDTPAKIIEYVTKKEQQCAMSNEQ